MWLGGSSVLVSAPPARLYIIISFVSPCPRPRPRPRPHPHPHPQFWEFCSASFPVVFKWVVLSFSCNCNVATEGGEHCCSLLRLDQNSLNL